MDKDFESVFSKFYVPASDRMSINRIKALYKLEGFEMLPHGTLKKLSYIDVKCPVATIDPDFYNRE